MAVKVSKTKKVRVCQGDLFRDVEMIEYVDEKAGNIFVSKIRFPAVVVLTQDCDLEQEHKVRWTKKPNPKQDKWLMSVLVAPLYNVEHVYQGKHLSDLGMEMAEVNSKKSPGERLRQNETPRYHYIDFPSDVHLPASVIDFKHYFSVSGLLLRRLRRTNYIGCLGPLFREDVSQRFASFLSRIGLPD
jgi:hypothetical protein